LFSTPRTWHHRLRLLATAGFDVCHAPALTSPTAHNSRTSTEGEYEQEKLRELSKG